MACITKAVEKFASLYKNSSWKISLRHDYIVYVAWIEVLLSLSAHLFGQKQPTLCSDPCTETEEMYGKSTVAIYREVDKVSDKYC